ncbi:nucleotidyltransferase [Thermovenabulum gondwanense]|uniref:tRNA(Met) cytidine acetate ligase n=1 Tax=Thermovenabulum gondwanense TaxID=520767 RepID=A0A162MN78_9FIRM|nr:nucleotidyltransferase [Thermovenabulum gondwanense]KYO66767.1 hypothetical protein ATZ99_10120 [Thermovenabulum gondwanense]
MKIIGIVAEYNPFHNGHYYHLNKIKEEFNPDAIIIAMSGNFVQRGEPAIFDKWARTYMALKGGADMVVELPVIFSASTAEIFAEGAINLLGEMKIVNYLSFGVEEKKEKELIKIAEILTNEPPPFKQELKSNLKKGLSFPSAREAALIELLKDEFPKNDLSILLKKPNFILGIEYCKAILKNGYTIDILPVLRKGSSYHELEIKPIPSATAVRRFLKENPNIQNIDENQELKNSLPYFTLDIIKNEIELKRGPVFFEDFEEIIFATLLKMSREDFNLYFDVKEGLDRRIQKAVKKSKNILELIDNIKTKRYPETRIRRILTQILLNITKNDLKYRKPNYIRILGFSKKGFSLIKEIEKSSSLPIVISAKDINKLKDEQKKQIEKDILASDIYSLARPSKEQRIFGLDYFKKPIII